MKFFKRCVILPTGLRRFTRRVLCENRRRVADALSSKKDFPTFCSTIIYNVWNAFIRERSPNWENLKNKTETLNT
ncbi:MAG: hypothetical protein M3Q33_05565 [Acidobacteriota bacterium]|nr:hypothetical protein [Acidobacteriota bacterium]